MRNKITLKSKCTLFCTVCYRGWSQEKNSSLLDPTVSYSFTSMTIHRPEMPSAERERKCTCDHDGDPSSSLLLDRPEAGGEVIKHKHSIFSLGTSHSHNTVTVTVFSLFSAPKAYVYFVYLITSINKIKSAYIHYNNEHITVFTVTVIRKTF